MENGRPRIHVIGCGVLALDIKAIAERLGLKVSMQWLPGGLHRTPHDLRKRLQEAIDQASGSAAYDRLVLGYGLCGLGAAGIHARGIPLAMPRVHDCIAMFLGSDAAYREQFARYPGTYYIAAGWVEEQTEPLPQTGKDMSCRAVTDRSFDELVAKYGLENSEAIRHFLNSWQRNYQRAAFIDTGVAARRRYADIARRMASEFGWKYEELRGTGHLLGRLLTQETSSDEILIVPPRYVTRYDPLEKKLQAVPVREETAAGAPASFRLVVEAEGEARRPEPDVHLGLGIDAGGTYTDIVVYDFARDEVLQKAKALTTKWDFTLGIGRALEGLDPACMGHVQLVSISTTLATNAIVEGRGQKVGLLVMPPYGRIEPSNFTHTPLAVIDGQLEIDGSEIAPVNPDQVRQIVRDMVARDLVGAFAVAGYASHANPMHELAVKAIIREETGRVVTCGHDVSEGLNYRVRAETAALNARIIPCLEALLTDVRTTLKTRGIEAPIMVVKSDGSLMSLGAALERPIETILSGPAASVAGARRLARRTNAIVVDIGGTTTDTATIRNGVVGTCEDGATVGAWKTHVRALDMRTAGLGGDSLIAWEKGEWRVGPRRVAPVSWLCRQAPEAGRALDWIEARLDSFAVSTRGADLMVLNGDHAALELTEAESRVVEVLAERPMSLDELAGRARLNSLGWTFLPLVRLEENFVIQRCGLTPTDLLQCTGQLELWDVEASRRLAGLFSRLARATPQAFAGRLLEEVVRRLALELLKKQMDGEVDSVELDASPAALALIDRALGKAGGGLRVSLTLDRPVVGIGAPAHYFVPEAAKRLGAEAVIPPHADVANAVGAITSSVLIHRQVRLSTDETGRFILGGVPGAPSFTSLEEAQRFAVEALRKSVSDLARQAGTSETKVEILVDDQVAQLADGEGLFIGRTIEARLSGRPDVARLAAAR